jgi:hypothetical protein
MMEVVNQCLAAEARMFRRKYRKFTKGARERADLTKRLCQFIHKLKTVEGINRWNKIKSCCDEYEAFAGREAKTLKNYYSVWLKAKRATDKAEFLASLANL